MKFGFYRFWRRKEKENLLFLGRTINSIFTVQREPLEGIFGQVYTPSGWTSLSALETQQQPTESFDPSGDHHKSSIKILQKKYLVTFSLRIYSYSGATYHSAHNHNIKVVWKWRIQQIYLIFWTIFAIFNHIIDVSVCVSLTQYIYESKKFPV